jgi:hypothetical protein
VRNAAGLGTWSKRHAKGAPAPGASETGRAVREDDAPGFAELLEHRISGESVIPSRFGQHPPARPD